MSKKIIFENLTKLAIMKGQEITSERIKLYTEMLSNYDFEKVQLAITRCLIEVSFFPDIKEILNRLEGETPDEKAEKILEKIMNSISQFGYTQPKEARKHMGEMSWEVVNGLGGWSLLCSADVSQIGMMRAQIRKMAKSKVEVYDRGERCAALASETAQFEVQSPKGMSMLGENLKQL